MRGLDGIAAGGFAFLNLPKQIQDITTALDEGHDITAGLEALSTVLEFTPLVPAQILSIITNLIARYTSPKDGSLFDEKKFKDELSVLQNEAQLYVASNSFWGEEGFVSDVGNVTIDWVDQTGRAIWDVVTGEHWEQLKKALGGNLTFAPSKLELATKYPNLYDNNYEKRNKYGIDQQLIGDNANANINRPGFWDTMGKIMDADIGLKPIGAAHASELLPFRPPVVRPPLPEGQSYLNLNVRRDSEQLTNEARIRQDLFDQMDDSLFSMDETVSNMDETVSNIRTKSAEDTSLHEDNTNIIQNNQSDIYELYNNSLTHTEQTFENINISIEDTVEYISSSLENTFANIGSSLSNMFDNINLISSANAADTSNNYVGHGDAGSSLTLAEKLRYDSVNQDDNDFPRDYSQWTDDMDDHYTQSINNLNPTSLEQTRESDRNTKTLTNAINALSPYIRTMLPDNLPTRGEANVPVKPNYEKRPETESESRSRRFTADLARYLGDTSLAKKLDSEPLKKDFEQPGLDNNRVNQNLMSKGSQYLQNQQLTMAQKVNMLSDEDRDTYEFGDRDYSLWTNKMQEDVDTAEFGDRDYSLWTNKMQGTMQGTTNPWMELLPNHPKWNEPYKESETDWRNNFNSTENDAYYEIDKSDTAARTYAEILRNLQIPQYIQSQLPNGMIKDYSTGGFINTQGFSQSSNIPDDEGLGGGLGGAYESFNKRAMAGWEQEAKDERMRSGRQRRMEDDRNALIFTTPTPHYDAMVAKMIAHDKEFGWGDMFDRTAIDGYNQPMNNNTTNNTNVTNNYSSSSNASFASSNYNNN
jgi:hypothetical protein